MADLPLAVQLRQTRQTSATIDGQIVLSFFKLSVPAGGSIQITRQRISDAREQSLNLRLTDGLLRTNGVSAPTIALRSTRCPAQVTVDLEPPSTDLARPPLGKSEVAIWNSWYVDGIEHAWVGRAGIRVAGTNPVVLECADGLSDGKFRDLVVQLEVFGPDETE